MKSTLFLNVFVSVTLLLHSQSIRMNKSRATIIAIFLLLSSILSAQTDFYQQNALRYENKIYDENIHTIQVVSSIDPYALPVIPLYSHQNLTCSFDDLEGGLKTYYYTLIHCDARWNPSELEPNEYLKGFNNEEIRDYTYSFNTIVPYTHYSFTFPNETIRPSVSGNFLLVVYLDSPKTPVFTRRVMVSEEAGLIKDAKATRALAPEEMQNSQEVSFNLLGSRINSTNPDQQITVSIMQNQRWDNLHMNVKPRVMAGDVWPYEFLPDNVFEACNEFRAIDLKSFKYYSERVASIESNQNGYEIWLRTDKPKLFGNYISDTDLNGRMIIKTEDGRDDNTEGEYANVHFSLAINQPLVGGNLYLIGEMTGFSIQPQYKMTYNYSTMQYETTQKLKQGYYNYLYVWVADGDKKGSCYRVEGNYYDARNEYNIFIYYKPIGGRYDRLLDLYTLPSP